MRKFNFDYNKIKEQIKKEESNRGFKADTRFWTLTREKGTNKGSAIIRFLPDQNGTPFKQFFHHWFKYETANGVQVYADKCRTTVDTFDSCPICSKNKQLWDSSFEVDNDLARERGRKNKYVANILVIKDPAKPENEGKVFLFEYGAQIHKMYNAAMYGPDGAVDGDELDDEEVVTFMPCDFDNGADFLIKTCNKKDTRGKETQWMTYEYSKFKPQATLMGLSGKELEKKIDVVMENTHDLSEWSNEENYPTKEKVLSKVGHILGIDEPVKEKAPARSARKPAPKVEEPEDDFDELDAQLDANLGKAESSDESMDEEAYIASLVTE